MALLSKGYMPILNTNHKHQSDVQERLLKTERECIKKFFHTPAPNTVRYPSPAVTIGLSTLQESKIDTRDRFIIFIYA